MNDMTISEARLTEVTCEIRVIREQAKATLLSAACEIGKRLKEVKYGLPNGRWCAWLRENVEFSERQAQNLMKLFEEFGKNPNPQLTAGIPVTKAIALLGAPEEMRRELIDDGSVENLSVKKLEEEIRQRKRELEDRQMKIEALEDEIHRQNLTLEEAKRRVEDAEGLRNTAAESIARAERRTKNLEENLKETDDMMREQARRADDMELKYHQAQEELREREADIDELKRQIDEAASPDPGEIATVTVETVPREIEEELERLREIAQRAPDEKIVKAREAWARGLRELTECVNLLDEMDGESRARYAKAFAAGLKTLSERCGRRCADAV